MHPIAQFSSADRVAIFTTINNLSMCTDERSWRNHPRAAGSHDHDEGDARYRGENAQ
jgi:hypothetical protein